MTFGLLLFIVALLVVIMVHESGHFLVAKAFDFKATKFFLGFGPTLWSVQKGETEYGVKALPLGGFVKIVGMNPYEDVPAEDRSRSYPNKPRWQRALVIVAGSATHWVVAFVLLVFASMVIGFPTGAVSNKLFEVTTDVGGVETAAGRAGLRPGDRIVGVDSRATESWGEIRSFIRSHAGDEVAFQIESDGEVRDVTVVLGTALFDRDGALIDYAPPGESIRAPLRGQTAAGFLGVQPEHKYVTESFFGAIGESGRITWDITTESVSQIGNVFTPVFNGELLDAIRGEGERPGGVGIVGASRLAGESVEKGRFLDFIGLVVGFTIFVGIINLLPLPPLDGGHLAVVAYEAVTRREVDVRRLIPIAAAVISFFIVLFLAYFYLDVVKPISPF